MGKIKSITLIVFEPIKLSLLSLMILGIAGMDNIISLFNELGYFSVSWLVLWVALTLDQIRAPSNNFSKIAQD